MLNSSLFSLSFFQSGDPTPGWIGRVMERFDKAVRAARGLCPLAQRNLPINHWLSYVAQACSVAPRHHSSSSPLSFPHSSSLRASPLCDGEAAVLEVAVRDTRRHTYGRAHTPALSVCAKGCSGRRRAECLSVSGTLVMCGWYSLHGMWTPDSPVYCGGFPALDHQHEWQHF